jgi:hypothetical protein
LINSDHSGVFRMSHVIGVILVSSTSEGYGGFVVPSTLGGRKKSFLEAYKLADALAVQH